MGKKFWADVMAFIVFMLGIGGFVTAVGHHYLTAPPGAPLSATVYEDGSWVNGDDSGCIQGAACDDKSHGETSAPIATHTPQEPAVPDVALCEEDAGYPCFDDFGDVTVYEDGSWVDAEGNSGCIKGAYCDDESHDETVAPTCADEYESTDCYYTQGDTTWYVDANGDAHEVTE